MVRVGWRIDLGAHPGQRPGHLRIPAVVADHQPEPAGTRDVEDGERVARHRRLERQPREQLPIGRHDLALGRDGERRVVDAPLGSLVDGARHQPLADLPGKRAQPVGQRTRDGLRDLLVVSRPASRPPSCRRRAGTAPGRRTGPSTASPPAMRRTSCANLANVASGSYGHGRDLGGHDPDGSAHWVTCGGADGDGWGWGGDRHRLGPLDEVTGGDHVRSDRPQRRGLVGAAGRVAQLGTQPAAGMERAARGRRGQAGRLTPHEAHLLDAVDRRPGGQQRPGVRMVGRLQRPARRPLLHEAPQVHHADAVAQVAHHAQVVGDEQVRQAVLATQVGEQVEDLRLDRHVQRRGRLVQHQQLRPQREGTRDGHALALAARQLVRPAGHVRPGEADLVQQRADPRLDLPRAQPAMGPERLRDHIRDPGTRVERPDRVLEHDLHLAPQRPQVGTASRSSRRVRRPRSGRPSHPPAAAGIARASSCPTRTRRRGRTPRPARCPGPPGRRRG